VAVTDPSRCTTESANPPVTGKNVQRNINTRSPLVQALGTALAAIPAYQSAHADAPPAFSEMGIRYTHYDEDKLGGSTFIFGRRDRYDIAVRSSGLKRRSGALGRLHSTYKMTS